MALRLKFNFVFFCIMDLPVLRRTSINFVRMCQMQRCCRRQSSHTHTAVGQIMSATRPMRAAAAASKKPTGSSLERVLSSGIQTGILISLSLSRASLAAAAQRLGLAAAAGGYR